MTIKDEPTKRDTWEICSKVGGTGKGKIGVTIMVKVTVRVRV